MCQFFCNSRAFTPTHPPASRHLPTQPDSQQQATAAVIYSGVKHHVLVPELLICPMSRLHVPPRACQVHSDPYVE